MKHILLVEDDTALREGLVTALQSDSFTIRAAADLASARRILREHSFDLLLLDVNLPDGSGIDLCREVTAVQNVPVIFLTVRDAEIDEVTAFRAGACDYIKKPFSLTILQERIAAALRKRSPNHIYEDSRFRFDFTELVFSADGVRVILSATEQKLLSIFCNHKGQILERQTLVDKIWSCDSDYIDENALSVTVKRLRDKLGADCIGTVYGMGYVWKGSKK
ncbi:MAG: response regulator transcription factor [Clostridia bacterium]|nr:response regulator transcription factor [Clostridia bacterium]